MLARRSFHLLSTSYLSSSLSPFGWFDGNYCILKSSSLSSFNTPLSDKPVEYFAVFKLFCRESAETFNLFNMANKSNKLQCTGRKTCVETTCIQIWQTRSWAFATVHGKSIPEHLAVDSQKSKGARKARKLCTAACFTRGWKTMENSNPTRLETGRWCLTKMFLTSQCVFRICAERFLQFPS